MPSQGDVGYNKEHMMVFMIIMIAVVFSVLVLVGGVYPQYSAPSRFELERRRGAKDERASASLRRDGLLPGVMSLQRISVALLIVTLSALLIARFDWLGGVLLAIAAVLMYGPLARIGVVHHLSQKAYSRYEPAILRFVEKFTGLFQLLRHPVPGAVADRRLESREEFEHLVAQSHGIMSAREKTLLTHVLQFDSRTVGEIMIPRESIDSIDHKELLGPLVLDDLHKTTHSRFPVVDADIDHVVGMLHVQDLLSLDMKKSTTAEKAMDRRVYYIHERQTLQQALTAFLRTHHHLFIVVNERQETVGLLSLEDVIGAMTGQKNVDEFDAHDDLRTVAKRNPRTSG